MIGARAIIVLCREWIAAIILISGALLVAHWHPSVARLRNVRQAARCGTHMEVLLDAELNHYRDHQSFTTVQNDLNRYTAYAPHARCPLCKKQYAIAITDQDVVISCPCIDSGHGRKFAPAPVSISPSPAMSDSSQQPQ